MLRIGRGCLRWDGRRLRVSPGRRRGCPSTTVAVQAAGTMGRHHHGWVHFFYGSHRRFDDGLELLAGQVEAPQDGVDRLLAAG